MIPTVAIVGRPNVGKSRLFNRLTGRRIAIVHDQPGVTRDVLTSLVDGTYRLCDTGGLGLTGDDTPRQIVQATERQVGFAIERADLILFMVDAREGYTPHDESIAATLRRADRPLILVVNKVDTEAVRLQAEADFARAGLRPVAFVSAEHGMGEGFLREAIRKGLGLPEEAGVSAEETAPVGRRARHQGPRRSRGGARDALAPEDAPEPSVVEASSPEGEVGEAPAAAPAVKRPLRLAIVGRPNVGKSSLGNCLLRSERLIVSEVPGTTRDAIALDCTYRFKRGGEWSFTLIDTAGIRHGQKVSSPVEYFSRIRSLDAIAEADLVVVVLDAMDGVGKQDKAIAGEVVLRHKPVVVAVNKWDLVHEEFRKGEVTGYDGESDYRRGYAQAVTERLFFTPGSPTIFISAKKAQSIDRLLQTAREVEARLDKDIQTARLNQVLKRLTDANPPPHIFGQRFRIYYATQTGRRPYRIRVFCNQERKLSETYRRYLEAGLVEEFGLQGCPILFDLVGKPAPESEG